MISPSLIGTLKSARSRTTLPFKSKSETIFSHYLFPPSYRKTLYKISGEAYVLPLTHKLIYLIKTVQSTSQIMNAEEHFTLHAITLNNVLIR